jgi:hypothetical protein
LRAIPKGFIQVTRPEVVGNDKGWKACPTRAGQRPTVSTSVFGLNRPVTELEFSFVFELQRSWTTAGDNLWSTQ